MTHVERNELWKMRILDYQTSGLTVHQFSEHHQLNIHTMKYWIHKFRTNTQTVFEPTSQWLTIDLNESSTPRSLHLFVGDVRIEVSSGFDSHLLCDVVRALKTC